MTSPSLMQETGHPKPVHWDNPEGWNGEGRWEEFQDGRTHVYLWLIHVNVWQKPPQYCKVISLQLNQLILKKKKKEFEKKIKNFLHVVISTQNLV